jgi:hypothetical protein
VGKDAGKFGAGAVESDSPLAQEGPGVYGTTTVAESGDALDAQGLAAKGGHAVEHGISFPSERRMLKKKKPGGHHRFRVTQPGREVERDYD